MKFLIQKKRSILQNNLNSLKYYILLFFLMFLALHAGAQQDLSQLNLPRESEFIEAIKQEAIGNLPKAAELFEKLAESQDSRSTALFYLARLYRKSGRHEDAIKAITECTRLAQSNKWFWVYQANLMDEYGRNQSAAEAYAALSRLEPDNYTMYDNAALRFLQAEKPEEALGIMESAQAEFGLNPLIAIRKAELYSLLKKDKKAKEALDGALIKYPENTDLLEKMIQFYENSSNTEQALAYMERLRKIDPSNKRFNKQSMGSGVTEVQFGQFSNDPTITIDEKIKKMIPVLESEHFLTDTAFSNRIKNEIHQLAYENKNDLKLQALYGDALFLKKEYREASNQYIRAIELGKVPYSVWEHGIYSLIQSNRWISLEKYLNIALNYFPNQSYLYFALARALIELRKYEEADDEIKRLMPMIGSNTSKVIDSKILQYRLLMAKNKNDEAKALIQSIEINNLSSAQIIEYSLAENCEVKQQNDLGQKLSEAWADDKLPLEYRLFSQSNTSFCKGDILNASKSMDRIVQSGIELNIDQTILRSRILSTSGKKSEAVLLLKSMLPYAEDKMKIESYLKKLEN